MQLTEARVIEPSSELALRAAPARINAIAARNACELVGVSADSRSIQLYLHSPSGDVTALVSIDFNESAPTLEPWLPQCHRY